MRATILLIVLLAASFSAHAEKTYYTAIDVSLSYDYGDSFTDPESCSIGLVFDDGDLFLNLEDPVLFKIKDIQGISEGTVVWNAFDASDGTPFVIQMNNMDRINGHEAIDLYIIAENGFIVSYTAIKI